MATQYPGSWKQCATCAFWMGPRTCDVFGQRVTVNNACDRGMCGIPQGGWRRQQRQANQSCSDWQKWPVLR